MLTSLWVELMDLGIGKVIATVGVGALLVYCVIAGGKKGGNGGGGNSNNSSNSGGGTPTQG